MRKAVSVFLLSFIVSQCFAQIPVPAVVGPGRVKGSVKPDDQRAYLSEQGVERYLLTLDYNTWFEKLTITSTSGTEQDSQALCYGFGLGVEKNWYQPKWGWGLGAAILSGSIVGGDKSGSLSYFQARVPWWAVRVAPRLFYRWTPRTDFGLDLAAFYKKSSWPDGSSNAVAKSGSDLITGIFADMRVRFNLKLEMIQSFGMVYKDESIYWRLGLAYRL